MIGLIRWCVLVDSDFDFRNEIKRKKDNSLQDPTETALLDYDRSSRREANDLQVYSNSFV